MAENHLPPDNPHGLLRASHFSIGSRPSRELFRFPTVREFLTYIIIPAPIRIPLSTLYADQGLELLLLSQHDNAQIHAMKTLPTPVSDDFITMLYRRAASYR